MPIVIDEVSAEVIDTREPERPAGEADTGGRPRPDMERIMAELRREVMRRERVWAD